MNGKALPWVLRVLWAVVPFTAGSALAHALHDADVAVRTVASVGLWAGWAVGLLATFVAHPISLTALRVIAPAAVAATLVADVHGGTAWTPVVAVAGVVAFMPGVGLWAVNGPAYPNERRYPLRPPGALLVGPIVLAWAVAVAGPVAAPLLLAGHHWVAGTLATVVGIPLAVVLVRALHSLSRRWVVFVPAGLVVHDAIALTDPVLFRREQVGAVRPAPAATTALDLSQRAPGLALELQLREEAELRVPRLRDRAGEVRRASALLVTPTRPGAVVAEAGVRRLNQGVRQSDT